MLFVYLVRHNVGSASVNVSHFVFFAYDSSSGVELLKVVFDGILNVHVSESVHVVLHRSLRYPCKSHTLLGLVHY
jgi:hypothetical protein